MIKQETVFYCRYVTVSSTALMVLNYDKRRTAYTIMARTNDLIIGPDNSLTATNGLYLPKNVPIQFELVHGFDTRMPVYAIRAGDTDGIFTARVDSQEKETDKFPGV